MTAVSEDADVYFTQNTMHGLLCDVPLSVPNSNKFTCHDRRGRDADIMSIETGSTIFLGGFMIPTFDVYSELQDCYGIPTKLRCARCAKR